MELSLGKVNADICYNDLHITHSHSLTHILDLSQKAENIDMCIQAQGIFKAD